MGSDTSDNTPFDPLKGSNILLIGEPGAGKTDSLTTLIEAGLELCVLITDPGGEESLIAAMERRKLPMNRLHTKYIGPSNPSWADLITMAKMVHDTDYKFLSELKTGIAKKGYDQFMQVLATLANFTSDQGQELGNVDNWPASRALVIDSLTGINLMARELMAGGKPTLHQGEWGVAMSMEEKLILKLCAGTRCFFVLTAHLERELFETQGRVFQSAAALGKKLAPKLPRTFSDIVLAYKAGKDFLWSTATPDTALKNRLLANSDKLPATFVPLIREWERRGKLYQQQRGEQSTPTIAS